MRWLILGLLWVSMAFPQTESRVLEIILASSSDEARKLLARYHAGESFEILAQQYSTDPSAGEGGYLGQVNLNDLRPEFQAVARNLKPGLVSDVFPLASGFAIAKALTKPRMTTSTSSSPQMVAYVSGFEEAAYYFSKLPKPQNFDQDLKAICDLKTQAIQNGIRENEEALTGPPDPESLLRVHHTQAQLRAYKGDLDGAVKHFELALKIAQTSGLAAQESALREKLAIAWLRKGEWDNCITGHNARSCIYPLSKEARHRIQEGSRRSFHLFLDFLLQRPEDLEVRWLLSLAAQTLGGPPVSIPPGFLLPDAAPSLAPGQEFVDIAHPAGLHRMNNAGGSILDDFNNDGRLDLAISVVNACEPMGIYWGDGKGHFTEATAKAKLTSQLGGININHADYNNDGLLDIFVMRGGWEFPMRNSLLKNNGDGTFSDVTAAAGLAVPAYPTPTAAWADFDNDGWVDLFIGNENAPGQLFRNKGDGTFVDVAAAAGVDKTSFAKASAWGDFDNDGYPDLYVSNYGQPNFLYRNNHNGTFTEVAKALGVEAPVFSFPTWFFDYDNDGCADLFVSSYVQSVASLTAELLGRPGGAETMRLYRNTCHGSFVDVSREAGVDRVSMAMSANFGDIDNDGYLDFYLGTGSPSYGALVPNLLFHNDAGKRFTDITYRTGTGHLQKGHGISFGDVDGDGAQDVFLHTGGAIPGDVYGNVLFKNPGTANHSLRVKLVGVKSNRAAIGARVKATFTEPGSAARSIYRTVSSGASFGSSSFVQWLGLGRAAKVDTLEITWPTTGVHQAFQNIAAGQTIEIKENQTDFRCLQ